MRLAKLAFAMTALTQTVTTASAIGLIVGLSIVQIPQVAMAQNDDGFALLRKGWVNDAIKVFQAELKKNPQNLTSRLGLAKSFLKAGNLNEAWSNYQLVLKQEPGNLTALEAIGKLGEYRSAWQLEGIAALNQFLESKPGDRDALAQRALLLGYQGNFGASLADYDNLLKSGTVGPEVLIGAAKINTYAGNYSKARKLFEQASPGGNGFDEYSLAAYATALTQTGSASNAIVRLNDRLKTPKLDPNAETDLRKALAIALAMTGNVESGLKVLNEAPGNPLAIAQGYAEIARKTQRSDLYAQAVSRYRSLLKSSPSTALTLEAADVMSEQLGTQGEALKLYDSVASQLDANHPAQFKRLMLGYRMGTRSATEVEQVLSDRLTDPKAPESLKRTVAQTLVSIDPPEAKLLSIYQSLAGEQSPFLYYRIAQIHIQSQKFDLARAALQSYQATAQGKEDVAPDLLLATIDQTTGKLEDSADRFAKIAGQTDRFDIQKSALRGLAGVRVQQRKFDEALVAYDRILAIDSQDGPAKLGRARLAMVARKIKVAEARAVLDQWLTDNPNTTPPSELFDLAGALPADESLMKVYDRLLALNSNNVDVQRRSLQLLAEQNPGAARTQLAAYMERAKGDINAYYLQGEVARTLGDLDLAASGYQAILDQQPDNMDALMALGGVRFEQKNYAEAGRIYDRATTLKPNDWKLRRTIADLSLAQDQPLRALEQLKVIQSLQRQQGITDEETDYQIMAIEVEKLKRRSFQTGWEGYTPSK